MWKNNDLRNVIAKMATISAVAKNGASTLHESIFGKFYTKYSCNLLRTCVKFYLVR